MKPATRTATITKIFRFEAAHRLLKHRGECFHLHGHSYELWVTVAGPLDENGMVADFKDLKEVVREAVIRHVDHRYLNDVMEGETTAENLVHWAWDRLEEAGLRGLCRIRLWETTTCFAEITRANRGESP